MASIATGRLERLRSQRDAVLAVAQAYGANNVRVFGSTARGEAHDDSDIDLLVSFGPEITLFRHRAFENELTSLLGIEVEVVSDRGLRPDVREAVNAEAVAL